MMLGPAEHHTHDTCRMWNLKTRRVIITRDIRWLDISYGDYYKRSTPEYTQIMMLPTDDSFEEPVYYEDESDNDGDEASVTDELIEIPDVDPIDLTGDAVTTDHPDQLSVQDAPTEQLDEDPEDTGGGLILGMIPQLWKIPSLMKKQVIQRKLSLYHAILSCL